MTDKKKILYVDDEEMNLVLFKYNFSSQYDLILANNGFEGLKLLDNHPDIDAIFSDMRMPQMNGLEFILKAKKKHPDKRFYILTAFDFTPEIETAMESKLILGCYQKPLNVDEIEHALKISCS